MYLNRPSNYDKSPFVDVPGYTCDVGWDSIAARLADAARRLGPSAPVVAVECYPGVDEDRVAREINRRMKPALTLCARDAMRPAAEVDLLVGPFLGGDDPVFGMMCDLPLDRFFDPARLDVLRGRLRAARDCSEGSTRGVILVVGVGAALVAPKADILVYADLARWEAQLRFRRNESSNLGVDNPALAAGLQYKRAFFVDWRVADCFKKPLLKTCDFVLDTNTDAEPKLATGEAVREGLRLAVTRPFRVVPFFDPAPWGGQWMKEVCGLDPAPANYGWCFDCVPEENSLYLGFGSVKTFEVPSLDVVFLHPRELLGDAFYGRFGDEFPIRFDFLDTMAGGNLSLQVHPLTEYIRHTFGMQYTQDESYYMLDAGADACVYLGIKTGVDPVDMLGALTAAQTGGPALDVEKYVNRWPARKHDHFLIPAGTIHCSGGNAMVLEISATPYIFTFKLWDWGRMGLDGKPRPIHLNHGRKVIQFDRDTEWTRRELVNRFVSIASGDGWVEECTGLHEKEFIETRRHWFTSKVSHHTGGGVNVLNLIEGEEAMVESPTGAFAPFAVHYAETFIVPAAVGAYDVRPQRGGASPRSGTIKAYVRT